MRKLLSFTLALSLIGTVSLTGSLIRVHQPVAQAATLKELEKKRAALEAEAKAKAAAAKEQAAKAAAAAKKIQEVSTQIKTLEGTIAQTEDNIEATQAKIAEQNQDIAGLESELRKIKDQQDALLRQLYIMRVSMPDELAVFSNESISTRERQQEQFTSLKRSVTILFDKTTQAKLAIEQSRADLMVKSAQLESYKTQQSEQKRGLATYRSLQADLKVNATAAMEKYNKEAHAAELQMAKIEQQISAELTRIINARMKGNIAATGNNGPGVGKRVSRGDLVGHRGSTGYSTGPHVHFEVRNNNVPVNPAPYVSNGTLGWPVANFVITQQFGYTDFARAGAYGGGQHTGMDLAGPYGDPVYAPADGVVIMNQYYGGYGYAWAQQLDNGLVVLLGHMTGR